MFQPRLQPRLQTRLHARAFFLHLAPALLALLFTGAELKAQPAVHLPGSIATGASSGAVSVSVAIQQSGTIASVLVRSQGSDGYDFANAGAGSCQVGQSFAAGQQCTLSVTFTPIAPGDRRGAVVLVDSSGHVLGMQLLDAVATGPLAVFVPGTINTVAGDQVWIYGGDGGAATQSSIFLPFGVAVDAAGDLFIADSSNNRIRRVDGGTGVISTIAGNGSIGGAGDGGPATQAALSNPSSILLDAAGNVYFSDSGNNVIRKVSAFDGTIATVAGTMGTHGYAGDAGPANAASLNTPNGISMDTDGNLFLADTGNNVVRRVDGVTGTITTVAGTSTAAYTGDGGPAIAATLNGPWSVVSGPAGLLYIADQNNQSIRQVNAAGVISTIAGTGVAGFSGDTGPASAAQLNVPASVAVDVAGNLYVADSGNNRVRKINASTGIITTIAGNSNESLSGDNGPADVASLYGPYTLALDAQGSLLIADVFHNRIRKVSSNAATLQFQPMKVGRVAAPMSQTLENDGNASLTVASVLAITNAQVDAKSTSCTVGGVLDVLNQCMIGAAFAPTITGQQVAGSVNANTNAANAPGVITLLGQVLDIDPSTVTLTSGTNPSVTGSTVIFSVSATSAGTTPTGTVTLLDGSNIVATAQLASGTVTFSVSSLAAGQHSLTASYAGDSNNAAGISVILLQTVKDAVAATTTTLGASSSQIDAGASLRLTAAVNVSTAGAGTGAITGSVTFTDGATVLGTASIANGSATLTTTLNTGTHSVIASYTGSTNYSASASSALSVIAQKATTKTALSTSANPSNSGAPLTLSATVLSSGGTAGGTVSFTDGAFSLGTASLNALGVASLTVPGGVWTVGTHTLAASYGGDGNDGGSGSLTVPQVVNLAQISVSLSPSANPVGLGGAVTFYATATGNGGVPSGSIQFFDGPTPLGSGVMNATGNTSLTTSALILGSHAITAVYAGDALDGAGTSQFVTESVLPDSTSITLRAGTSPGTFGSNMTLTANVSGTGSQPGGSVTFLDAGTPLGSTTVDAGGGASLTLSTLAIGPHSLTAAYGGDKNHGAVNSNVLSLTILQSTTTALTLSTANSVAGAPVQIAVKVVGNGGQRVTGPIQVMDGTSLLSTLNPDQTGTAVMSTSSLQPGQHSLTAVFTGDASDAPSTSSPQLSTIALAGTTTTLSVSANPVHAGSPLVLTASVAGNGGSPSGAVVFHDGAAVLGTAAIASGNAVLTTSTLAPGIHNLTASYAGDALDGPSVSAALSEQVAQNVTVTLASSANPSLLTDNVTITVTLTNGIANAAAPGGTVTLIDGAMQVATANVSAGGTAVFTLTAPSLGQHTLVATYAGDNDDLPASSAPLIQTVTLRPTVTSLNASATNLAAGQQLVLISVVTGSGAHPPGGQVSFSSGQTVLGTATVGLNGVATLTLMPAQASLNVVANYLGDALYAGSASAALAITVGPTLEFTVATDPGSMTIQSGQHGTLTVNLTTAVNFKDTLSFGCAGLPASGTCTFSTSQVTAGGGLPASLTVVVDTGNPLGSGGTARLDAPTHTAALACLLPGGALLTLLLRRRRPLAGLLLCLLGLASVSMLSGCGNSFSQQDTPVGSYTFQVVATGAQTGYTETAGVALTVTK